MMILLLEQRELQLIEERNTYLYALDSKYTNYIHRLLQQKIQITNNIRYKYDELIKENRDLIYKTQTDNLFHDINDILYSHVVPSASISSSSMHQTQSIQTLCTPKSVTQECIHSDRESNSNSIKIELAPDQQATISQNINTQTIDTHRATDTIANISAQFPLHMSMEEAHALSINDMIDHRDFIGCFVGAEIVDKQGTNLKIHYNEWGKEWDTWCDFSCDLDKFAVYKSISKRARHRFFDLKVGDYIDVNPVAHNAHNGWKIGEIEEVDEHSGQIKIAYNVNESNYFHYFWSHVDNKNEIEALYTHTKVRIACVFCDAVFESMQDLRHHLMKTHPKRKFHCKYCTQAFSQQHSVQTHQKQHNNKELQLQFECLLCRKLFKCHTSFRLKKDLTYHLRRVHKIGDKTITTKSVSGHKREHMHILKDHQSVERSLKKQKINERNCVAAEFEYYVSVCCHLCDEHFDDIKKYGLHLKQHYDNDRNKIWRNCDLGCVIAPNHPRKTSSFTGVFPSMTQFVSHIATHTKQYPFKCNALFMDGKRCTHQAAQKFGLEKHWKNNHCKEKEKEESNHNDMQLSYQQAEKMIVSDLRYAMHKKGINSGGTKKTLLERLKLYLKNEQREKENNICIVPSLQNMPAIENMDDVNISNSSPVYTQKESILTDVTQTNDIDNFVSRLPSLQSI